MGACFTKNDATSKTIDAKLKEKERLEQSYDKLLFLGPGSSGKSTIFKQLQWLHGDGLQGYNESDIHALIKRIHIQIISQMRDAIEHYLFEHVKNEPLTTAIATVRDSSDQTLTHELAESITYIWQNDERLKPIFRQNHSKKVLDETTECFWNDIDRIKAVDYIPTKADIMNIRNRTTGIIQKKFKICDRNFHIFDVGGQKSERKKWITCFHDVRAVVFVVGLSSYNEFMFENDHKNYMVDAMELFDKTIHHKMFVDTPIILFLNKNDLFMNRMNRITITDCPAFDDYASDPQDYEQVTAYIKTKFEDLNRNSRKIYTHFTCAMDDQNIKNVFADVSAIFVNTLNQKLQSIE
eukprot:65115_1